ncbi:DMT family transporter [Paraferrimonas sedimenticola]|uniref:Membrane protein n=1 Tax=Paraferrimonas sedimenticola TaxID=375674 RepID=A0AA37RZ62_9GAMM|nr:DMT family transporter [Paraferrimonas sedimenticola]GLP97883.1 membrane protein [Paraferrimonas sedimenticola]
MRLQPDPRLALVIATLLWASSFIALKWAFDVYHPNWVIAGRMLVALACFSLFYRQILRFQYRQGDWKVLVIMSACEPCLYFIFESQALLYTSATQAGMMTAMAPVLTAAVAFVFLGERLTRRNGLGFGLAAIGVIWLTLAGSEDQHAPNPLLGNTLELLAMLCAAVYGVCLKLLSKRYSALTLTSLQAAVGSLFFVPLAAVSEQTWVLDWSGIGAIVYLGACVTLGAYLLYNYAVSQIPLTQAVIYVNLIPVFTAIMAMLLLGERLNGYQWLAAILVMAGVFLGQDKKRI